MAPQTKIRSHHATVCPDGKSCPIIDSACIPDCQGAGFIPKTCNMPNCAQSKRDRTNQNVLGCPIRQKVQSGNIKTPGEVGSLNLGQLNRISGHCASCDTGSMALDLFRYLDPQSMALQTTENPPCPKIERLPKVTQIVTFDENLPIPVFSAFSVVGRSRVGAGAGALRVEIKILP